MLVERDLLATVKMLRAEGLDADMYVGEGVIEVSLGDHMTAFDMPKFRCAADWLAACALAYYPNSDFSKLRRLLAACAARLSPRTRI